jgi:hypothetical protein
MIVGLLIERAARARPATVSIVNRKSATRQSIFNESIEDYQFGVLVH